MIVYHYTSQEAYNEIMRTREFRYSSISTAFDAAYGIGWYFTDLAPHTTSEEGLCQLWGRCVPERTNRYLVFDIEDSSLLHETRPNIYRLPLNYISEGVINLDMEYTSEGRVVIRFIRGGIRE